MNDEEKLIAEDHMIEDEFQALLHDYLALDIPGAAAQLLAEFTRLPVPEI